MFNYAQIAVHRDRSRLTTWFPTCHGGGWGPSTGSTGSTGPTGSRAPCLVPAAVLDDLGHCAGPVWATAGRATEQWAHSFCACAGPRLGTASVGRRQAAPEELPGLCCSCISKATQDFYKELLEKDTMTLGKARISENSEL